MPAVTPSAPDIAPARIEGWLAQHQRRVIVSLFGAAVFVRLLLCMQIAGGPLPRIHTLIRDSDNNFFDTWAHHLAAGDWLQRATLHPMHRWMQSIADDVLTRDPSLPVKLGLVPNADYDRASMRVALWDHWLGGRVFFQEPAYPYLVALTYRFTGPSAWHVFAWQLLLGVASVLLIYTLARRLFSETAAAAAGALAVLAPIPLFYEVTLLRDALVVFSTLALAVAMEWAPRGGRLRWLGLGLAFGFAVLVKQSFLAFPLLMGIWRLTTVRTRVRDRVATAGIVVTGMAIGLLPALLRNLVVGAPALALNGSGTAMLALFHAVDASPIEISATPAFARILAESDGHLVASLLGAARTHATAWGIVALNLGKVLYAWHAYEAPNNVDFYLFRQGAPLLAALPVTFVVIAPLAAIGAMSRRAVTAWPLLVVLLGSLATMVLAVVLSRYRAPFAAALMPLAGAGVVRSAVWASTRRWLCIAGATAATALYLVWALRPPSGMPGVDPAYRARSYAQIGGAALAGGEPAFASLHFQESLRLMPGNPTVELELGRALLADDEPEPALLHATAAAAALGSADAREVRARALAASGRREEAAAEARAVLAIEPGREDMRTLLQQIERGASIPTRREAIR